MEAEDDQLAALRSLHHELLIIPPADDAPPDAEPVDFPAIEKLCVSLERHIGAFRRLLDKTSRSEASRQVLAQGKLSISDTEYEVNDEFKEEATRLSDLLDLDQLESAALLLHGTEEAKVLDRTPIACAIIRYHSYRSFLVDSLRLILKHASDPDGYRNIQSVMRTTTSLICGQGDKPSENGSALASKCMYTMLSIEASLGQIADQIQKDITLGQVLIPAHEEIMGLQQQNLTQQHESLGIILAYLVKEGRTQVEDFKSLIKQMPKVDKWNVLAVHYAPSLIACCSRFGSTEEALHFDDARELHEFIIKGGETSPWPLRNFRAAFVTWWLAAFSSWFFEGPIEPQEMYFKPEQEAQARTDALYESLREGAFHCTLSICSQIKSSEWADPARVNLIRSLLHDAPVLPFEPASIGLPFRDAVLEAFENFTHLFVTNMPDTLRQFKADEDDKRRRLLAGLVESTYPENDRHLERFFVILSYVYEDRPDAAHIFWDDTDGNMHGFMQWFSRRLSTPLMGAYCEMFRSISAGEKWATAAHNFLLDEGSTSASRIRRASSLSWAQMFEELEFYASKLRDNPNSISSSANGKERPIDIDEPETPVMLECYLRLISHLSFQSNTVRQWLLVHPTFKLIDTVFTLSNSTTPSPIRTCSYACLQGLLVSKNTDTSSMIWTSLDQWVSHGFSSASQIPRPARLTSASTWAEDQTFEAISANHEESNAFVCLLQALVEPNDETTALNDTLPFPEELGSSYRMPGIEPYIDLIMGKIFASKVGQSEPSLKQLILASDVLRFVQICLESFNENLIILANRSGMAMDNLIGSSTLAAYTQMHPFTRVMEWLFNDRVLATLFRLSHQGVSEVNNASSDTPLIICLQRSIDVINLIMRLQSTYLDVVRPIVKMQSNARRSPVLNPALVCFEDAVATNLKIVVDLGYYAGSGHQTLAHASLELLQQFAASRKLNTVQSNRNGSHVSVNRLIGALQQQGDAEPIAVSMSQAMGFDDDEIAEGHNSVGFNIKYGILDFLDKTLSAHPNHPNVAHLLLGFDCVGDRVTIREGSPFANARSLFHVIAKLSIEYPERIGNSLEYWCLTIKSKAASILRTLWSYPLTSAIVLDELKETNLLFFQWLTQTPIDQDTLWEDRLAIDPDFIFFDSASTLDQYLRIRAGMYEYTSAALRQSQDAHISTTHVQIISSLLGMTIFDDVEQENPTVFDLADFMELNVNPPGEVDFDISRDINFGLANHKTADGQIHFNLKLVEQLLDLRRRALRQANLLTDENTEELMNKEIRSTVSFFNGLNNFQAVMTARLSAIKAWADLIVVLTSSKNLETELRFGLILQTLQLVLPKLETSVATSRPDAIIFAHLVQSLLSQMSSSEALLSDGHVSDAANDRLFALFKIALRSISSPDASSSLRATLYNVAYRYLVALFSENEKTGSTYFAQANQVVKVAGHNLIDILCDDILDAVGATRVSALLLLAAFMRLADRESSRHVIEALVRSNFIVVLVETVADMPDELRAAEPADVPGLVQGYRATLTLLLVVSQTRTGATHVLNAGLFAAVRHSGLFAADPDIGLEAATSEENSEPSALGAFYELLAGVLRVIVGVVVSRGATNGQTVDQARSFLIENRLSIVGVLKRRLRIAAADAEKKPNGVANGGNESDLTPLDGRLDEVMELFILLTNLTGFVEYEEAQDNTPRARVGRFS